MKALTQAEPIGKALANRFDENPLLKPEDVRPSSPGLKVESLLNPGAFQFQGRTWLLLRVAERPEQKAGKTTFPLLDNGKMCIREFDNQDPLLDLSDPRVINFNGTDYLTTLSHLRLVSSKDGVHFEDEPEFRPLIGSGDLESYGVEDCRITQIDARYLLTYSAACPKGVTVGLRSTLDWRTFTHHGSILAPHNKDCAIFNETIGGKYYCLHRPSSPELGGNYIWLAESPDLIHWGNHRCVATTREHLWDSERVGAGAAPIRTSEGWLEIYHGADADNRYCLGAMLLDLREPWKVIARSRTPIMEPVAPYERTGFFGNVVFTNGHIVSGDQLTIYYGAADTTVCGARFSISRILETLRSQA